MIKSRIQQSANNFLKLLDRKTSTDAISQAAELISNSVISGNKLIICGNGGSAADAQHVAGEFLCRFYKDRKPMSAIALTTDSSIITSISNDYKYEVVFSRQLMGIGKSGDVLLGISTSGNSKNVFQAFRRARQMNISTILLTGAKNETIAKYSDIIINVPSTDTPRVQEMHLLIEHIICEMVEQRVCD